MVGLATPRPTLQKQVELLFHPQHQIHHPAAADMRAGAATVVEDVGVVAAGVLEGVGEDGEAVEGALGGRIPAPAPRRWWSARKDRSWAASVAAPVSGEGDVLLIDSFDKCSAAY